MTATPRLCVDGPLRGEVRSTADGKPFRAIAKGAMRVTFHTEGAAPIVNGHPMPCVVYRPVTVQVGGRIYRVWASDDTHHGPTIGAQRDLHLATVHTLIDTEPHLAAACQDRRSEPARSA